eukprot:m51a1_g4574 hypothetical protein (80) ;mRNA; r:159691-160043
MSENAPQNIIIPDPASCDPCAAKHKLLPPASPSDQKMSPCSALLSKRRSRTQKELYKKMCADAQQKRGEEDQRRLLFDD